MCHKSIGETTMKSSDRAITGGRTRLIAPAVLLAASGYFSPLAHAYTKVVLNFTTTGTPAVAVYNGNVYMAFTGTNAQVYVAESTNGVNFGSAISNANAIASGVGPGLAAFNGALWLAWTGGYNYINLKSSANGLNFYNKIVLNQKAFNGPKLGVDGGDLWLQYAGLDSWHSITTSYSPDGSSFSTPVVSDISAIDNSDGSLPNNSVAAPTYSNAPYGSNTSVLWSAATESGEPNGLCPYHFFTMISFGQGSGPGGDTSVTEPGEPPPNCAGFFGIVTNNGVGITSLGSTVWLAYIPAGSDVIQMNVYTNGSLSDSYSTGHLAIANPTLLTYNGHVYLYWVGTDSAHHINAIEVQ